MSSEAVPISPSAFAAALRDLPITTLHLKAMELRNSIAHLDYSNEQLRPFANGTESSTNGVPDPDCVEAIRENEVVIQRQTTRIQLLKEEVQRRGGSWSEFRSKEEVEEMGNEMVDGMVNGMVNGETEGREDAGASASANAPANEERSSAWTDGTFQTGRIVGGVLTMHGDTQQTNGTAVNGTSSHAGGRLDDEALRRALEGRMRALAEEGDEDEGMHL